MPLYPKVDKDIPIISSNKQSASETLRLYNKNQTLPKHASKGQQQATSEEIPLPPDGGVQVFPVIGY